MALLRWPPRSSDVNRDYYCRATFCSSYTLNSERLETNNYSNSTECLWKHHNKRFNGTRQSDWRLPILFSESVVSNKTWKCTFLIHEYHYYVNNTLKIITIRKCVLIFERLWNTPRCGYQRWFGLIKVVSVSILVFVYRQYQTFFRIRSYATTNDLKSVINTSYRGASQGMLQQTSSWVIRIDASIKYTL